MEILALQKLRQMKKVVKPEDMTDQTFCLIIFSSETVRIPGDERSRTHPGHGYPEHTETISKRDIYVSNDKELVIAVVTALYAADPDRKDLVIIAGTIGTVKPEVTVNIDF